MFAMSFLVSLQLAMAIFGSVQAQNGSVGLQGPQPLKPGEHVIQQLGGHQVERYLVPLAAGQYVRFLVKEIGIDLVVAVSSPAGVKTAEINRSSGTQGVESVSVIADREGSYIFEVRAFAPAAPPGKYEASIMEPHTATAADQAVVVAEAAFARAQRSWTEYLSQWQRPPVDLATIVERFEKAARLAAVTRDRQLEAASLLWCATVSRPLPTYQKTMGYYERALSIQKAAGDQPGATLTLTNLGSLHRVMKDPGAALDCYSQALTLMDDARQQRTILETMADIYGSTGDEAKELGCLAQALDLPGVTDARGTASRLQRAAYLCGLRGEKERAQSYRQQALALYRQANDLPGQGSVLVYLGLSYWDAGDTQRGIETLKEAIEIERKTGNRVSESASLTDLGMVYRDIGELQKAVDCYKQAAEIDESLGNYNMRRIALEAARGIYAQLGEPEKASQYHDPSNTQRGINDLNSALARLRASGDIRGEAETLLSLSSAYWSMGEKQKALDAILRASSLFKTAGDHRRQGDALETVALFYNWLGNRSQAVEYNLSALQAYRDAGFHAGEASAMDRLGATYEASGNAQEALGSYKDALAIYRETGSRVFELDVLTSIGRVYESTGEWQSALDFCNQALDVARAALNHKAETDLLHRVSVIKQKTGNL